MRIRLHGSGGNIAWQQIRICIASSARSSSSFSSYLRIRAIFFSIRGKKRAKRMRKFGNQIRPREATLFCRFFFFHANCNSADSISKSAIRKCSLSDSYAFLIYYFCEILKGKKFTLAVFLFHFVFSHLAFLLIYLILIFKLFCVSDGNIYFKYKVIKNIF